MLFLQMNGSFINRCLLTFELNVLIHEIGNLIAIMF